MRAMSRHLILEQKPANTSSLPRGKKSKIKKMKKKYRDQDDEERKIKMSLLAVIKYHGRAQS
jgi:hypothetical protein